MAFFAVPTLLILISWDTLPGDRLYNLKTTLEDVTIFVALRTPLAPSLTVEYTQHRFSEANILLAKKGSTIGYTLLVKEIQESKDIIIEKKDTKKATELVTRIEGYQKEIEQKQIAIQTGGVKIPVVKTNQTTTIKTPQPTTQTPPTNKPTISSIVTTLKSGPAAPLVVVPEESEEDVVEELEKINDELEEVKEEIKNKLPSQASDNAKEKQEEIQEKKEDK